MSDDEVTTAPPPRRARSEARAYPRVTATPRVEVAAQDRRSTAVILTGAIGTRPRFELQQTAKERSSPGELGRAREAKRAAPPAPRRSAAPIGDADSSASAGAAGASGRRTAQPTSVAPTAGLSGLPGLGVFLGELGSPAKPGSAEESGRRSIAGMILGRGLRSVPSLADVDVAIGGDPGRSRGFGRLAVPLRALVRRSSRPEAAAGTLGAAAPATRPTAAMPKAAPAPRPAEPEPETEAPSQPGPLRRASSYLVNGLLDIAIGRFRADPRRR